MRNSRIEGDPKWEELQITNREMRFILRAAGFSLKAFGIYIERSHTYVGELGSYNSFIPSQHARALKQLVSPEAFSLHLAQVRALDAPKATQSLPGTHGGHHD